MTETISTPPFNRKAIIGFISALLALLSLCIGFLPIPLTAIPCYPLGTLFGVVSLILGLKAQREIKANGEGGKSLALISISTGVFTILAMICLVTTGIILLPRIYEWLVQAINQT